jgi:hypothetical protein
MPSGASDAGDDAANPDASTPDVADAGPKDAAAARCSPTAPFGAPEALTELGSSDVSTAWLTADENTLLFSAYAAPVMKVFVATRASTSGPFGAIAPFPGIQSSGGEWAGAMSADGLEIWYVEAQGPRRSKRASTSVDFVLGDPISLDTPGLTDAPPALPRPLKTGLYYAATTADETSSRLYYAAGNSGVAVLTPSEPLAGYAITSDERVLYYSTYVRIGTKIVYSTYRTTRAAVGQPFDTGVVVAELAQPSSNQNGSGVSVSWISDDECVVYGTAWPPGRTSETVVRAER